MSISDYEREQWDVVCDEVEEAKIMGLGFTREYFLATWEDESQVQPFFSTWLAPFAICGRILQSSCLGDISIENTCHRGIWGFGPATFTLSGLYVTIEKVDAITAYRKISYSRAQSKMAYRRWKVSRRLGSGSASMSDFYERRRVKKKS